MLNIAVLDDDLNVISDYEKNIPLILNKNDISGELIIATNSPRKFMDKIKQNIANVCIIDINLRTNVTGMHIANQIRELGLPCEILFMTGHLEYIQQAFDVQAYNFICKPGWSTLEQVLVKLSKDMLGKVSRGSFIDIKCNSQIFFVPINNIIYIERIQTKTNVYTTDNIYQTYEGLEELASRINDPRIKRCHRSIFININFVYSLDQKSKKITLTNGVSCDIGPKYYNELKTQKDWRNFLCL